MRHTAAGGAVVLEAAQNGSDERVICFRDTVSGIASDDLPHVVDRFYRGDESRQEEDGEFGLVLAIARSIVEMYGGTVTVDSALERGTTFHIRLPAR